MLIYDELKRRRKGRISREYKTCLMNNTKWAEVFQVLSQYEVYFKIYWIYSPWADTWDGTVTECSANDCPIEAEYIGKEGILDGGFIGGPFHYKEIASLKIPKLFQHENRLTVENNIESVRNALSGLGVLPISISEEELCIEGYEKV